MFGTPHLLAGLQLRRDLKSFVRVNFLYAALESGLLAALREPASKDEAAKKLQVTRPDLLEAFLGLGVALGELACDRGQYRIVGRRSRALAALEGDPLAAWLQESVPYHGSVYVHLADRLKGDPLGDYLSGRGTLIARSSRMIEPFMAAFVDGIVRATRPRRLLEIGCGSGVYLRYAAAASSQLTGIAIDIQADVVDQARSNLADWGIADRFQVMAANVLSPPPELTGPFDMITLYNNVYYFPVDKREALFRTLRSWMCPRGSLALVSVMQDDGVESRNFDVVLRSTQGCAPLPELETTAGQLAASGFESIQRMSLAPGSWLYGLLATTGGRP